MTLLATFVQLSDIHIGIPNAKGDSYTSPDVKRLACTHKIFHGCLGHQMRSLRHLERFFNELLDSGEQFEVILTGDLTRCGDVQELTLANHYLTTSANFSTAVPTGLRLGTLPQHVAGNHDHWGGYNSIFSTSASQYRTTAPYSSLNYPYVKTGPVLAGRRLTYIGIDSDADVHPGSFERLMGMGDFLSQLTRLETVLRPCHDDEFRILVIHHARHVTEKFLRMTHRSRKKLNDFLKVAKVKVVLSGHKHETYTYPPINGVVEFSSRSTTQIDEFPADWKDFNNMPPDPKALPDMNGFLVHRLHDIAGKLNWVAHVMNRDPHGNGFKELTAQTYYF